MVAKGAQGVAKMWPMGAKVMQKDAPRPPFGATWAAISPPFGQFATCLVYEYAFSTCLAYDYASGKCPVSEWRVGMKMKVRISTGNDIQYRQLRSIFWGTRPIYGEHATYWGHA